MKVHVYRCDACGKTVDDESKVTVCEANHFCEECIRRRKVDVKDYVKKIEGGADLKNEKFHAFLTRAQTTLTAVAIEAAIQDADEEENRKSGVSGSSVGTAGFATS